jgi:hypothetical protein
MIRRARRSAAAADSLTGAPLSALQKLAPPRDVDHGYTLKSQLLRRCMVSNSNTEDLGHASPLTIDEIVERCEPMGDLGRFAIDDLTAAEEGEFFAILEEV